MKCLKRGHRVALYSTVAGLSRHGVMVANESIEKSNGGGGSGKKGQKTDARFEVRKYVPTHRDAKLANSSSKLSS